ncbi:MAG: hypothetical protein NTW21_38040 [Verrucomicrobia bacterium]|nr:hypothetical protein [Verrucomicrobiota bacterium]
MIFLSILAKTFALALVPLHPWLAVLCWVGGALADWWVAQQTAEGTACAKVLGNVALLNLAAVVLGWAAMEGCDYAAMRWKDGIPVLASLVGGLLSLTGLSVGTHGGLVYLTTMAGPLEFAASIDRMGLKVPLLLLVFSGVWLGWAETTLRDVLRKLGVIAGMLLVVTVICAACQILLAVGLFDFVGYESEELPFRPFMGDAAGAWPVMNKTVGLRVALAGLLADYAKRVFLLLLFDGVWRYLPFLLATGVLFGRLLAPPAVPVSPPFALPRALRWGAAPLLLLLATIACWEPLGTPKDGKVVISTYHSQWSRTDRPYDRDWYGADSGYNYACMKRFFEVFYPVVEAGGPLLDKDLEGASTLVIYDPDRRFSQEEIKLVRKFVSGGGGLFVIGDHTNVFGSTSHLNELCEPFGFQYRDDVLFDLDEDFHQMMDAPWWPSRFWHGMSMFKLRGPTSLRPTSGWTRSVCQVGHSKGVRAIYSVNNFYPPPHDDPKMKTGTFCVSAASRYGQGRVMAWGDSTVFSNFEIFYPGKYEYLLNSLDWLNHRDGMLPALGRRIAALVLVAGVAGFLLRRREPRVWLVTAVLLVAVLGVARLASSLAEQEQAAFPKPMRPSEWVVFAAHAPDPGHNLRGFVSNEPYDQRYEVFIQWVLRTGAYPGFQLLDKGLRNGLYDHLREADSSTTALALIVRKTDDLPQLDELRAIPLRAKDPLLLMFASTIPAAQAEASIKRSGLVKNAEALAQIAGAWPNGEVVIRDGERRVMVLAGAERFSDQAMGISEKVVPDAGQRVLFNQAFGLIDRLFGRVASGGK